MNYIDQVIFGSHNHGRDECPTCKGVGSVWILPYGYNEWQPETWRKEHCPTCTAAQLLETLPFWTPATREILAAA